MGWASVTADPETGYLYAQNGDGHLLCLDREGKTVWERRLGEEMGRSSGYGGRTHTPLLDGEQLIMSVVGTGWGDLSALRQRYVAFDKRTGAVSWIATPSDAGVEDFNNQANAVVAEIGGRRLIIGGGADGWIYALALGDGRAPMEVPAEPEVPQQPGHRRGQHRLRHLQRRAGRRQLPRAGRGHRRHAAAATSPPRAGSGTWTA